MHVVESLSYLDDVANEVKANGPAKGVSHGMKIAWNRINEKK